MTTQRRVLQMLTLLLFLGLGGCASWFGNDDPEPQVHLAKVEVILMRWAEEIGRTEDEAAKKELLSSLVDLGLLHKDPGSRAYSPTPRAAMRSSLRRMTSASTSSCSG